MLGLDYIIAPQVPRGLGPAVEGLAREILRERPRNIYSFAARHFERLIELRDRGRILDKPLSGRTFGNGKSNAFIQDMTSVREQLASTPITRKIPKKKRQATGRSGWSINETIKVFKKYKYNANDTKDERLSDMALKKEAMGKGRNANDSEQCSPPYLEHIVSNRLVRSASVENVFAKNTGSRQNENKGEFHSLLPCSKRSLTRAGHKCGNHCKTVLILNRRRSVDLRVASSPGRFGETEDQPYISFRRKRSRSLVNEGGLNRNEESTGLEVGERAGRPKSDRGFRNYHSGAPQGTLAKNPQRGRKELERMLHNPEVVDTCDKLNVRSGRKSGQKLKNNEVIFDDVAKNTATLTQRVTPVVLPLVATRRRYTKNSECRFNDQRDSADNLTLPPIPSDALTSNERNEHLALPPLLVIEDLRLNSRPTYRYDHADSNVNWCGEERSVDSTEINRFESVNSDSRHSWRKFNENEISAFVNPTIEHRGCTVTGEDLNIVQDSSPSEKDIGESFKDSLNVTPDLIDGPQRPDSLEYFEGSGSTSLTADNEREKENNGFNAEEAHCRSNELKTKLIELEMVERSIETTLISSQGISACENGFEDSCFTTFSSVNGIPSDKSHSTFGNEAALVCNADTDRRSDEANETNLSCRDAVADSCIRSITPNEHCQQIRDDSFDRGSPNVINKDHRFDESHSSGNKDTRQEYEKGCQNYVDPFGEYINLNILDNSASIGGVHSQDDIENVIGFSVAYQDLENINEEEEEENAMRPDGTAESAERKNGIERKTELVKFGNHRQTDDSMECITGRMSTSSKAKESTMHDNRSSNHSLSSDDIAPYIPDLNLDSLQDLTASSLEENDSKYLERAIEIENCDITSCDDENISSSSGNTLISEKNIMTLSSENESFRKQFFDNCREVLTTGFDRESDAASESCKRVHQKCTFVDIPAAEQYGETSLSAEDNIADVQVDDFTEGTLMFHELIGQKNDQLRLEQIGKDGYTYAQRKQEHEGENRVEKGVRLSFSNEQRDKLSHRQRKYQEVGECLTSEHIIITEQKDDTISDLRHTGEFHDSYPLSLAEPANVPTSNIYSLKAVCNTASHSLTDQSNFIKNQLFVTSYDTSMSKCKFLQTIAPYSTEISSNSFRLLDNKPNWIELRPNDSGSVIYVWPIVNENFIEKSIVSVADTISKHDRDDCREPLALDTSPKPIIIEEISNGQDEQETCARVTPCKTDTYLPRVVGECLPTSNRHANCYEHGRKEILCRSLSIDETNRFINDNDILRNIDMCSSISQQNSNATPERKNAGERQAEERAK